MRRFLAMLGALAFGAACASAQLAAPADQARSLLQSPNLREKAWGAWYAGISHDPAMLAPILEQLRLALQQRDARPETEEYAYIQALFDALIQIPGSVPNDTIEAAILPFETSWRAEVLILMSRTVAGALPVSRQAERESELLAMQGQTTRQPEWDAVGDLLFDLFSKPFFESLMQEVRVTHTFYVVSPDQNHGGAADGGAIGCADSVRRFVKDFPPFALYQLDEDGTSGEIVLMARPVTVYYRRIVVPGDGQVPWRDCGFSPASVRRQMRVAQFLSGFDYLFGQQSEELFHPETIIRHDGSQMTAEIQGILDKQTASIESLFALIARRGVTASGLRLTIRPLVVDQRHDRTIPLPAVAPVEIVVP